MARHERRRHRAPEKEGRDMNGKTFEQFKSGDRYVTGRRTITEHDILQFVGLVGLTEPLFLDLEYIRKESLYGERIAPGSLTFGMAEGLTVQTGIIHGTGMAFAGLGQDAAVRSGESRRHDPSRDRSSRGQAGARARRRYRALSPVGKESTRRNDHGIRCGTLDPWCHGVRTR